VLVIGTRHIGKEANRWEEQFFVGLDGAATPDYGTLAADVPGFANELREITAVLGKKSLADVLGLSAARVRKALAGNASILCKLLESPALSKLREVAQLERDRMEAEKEHWRMAVEQHGLRGAARLYRIDPSNLSDR
jgi:hypothetical protein